MILSGKGGVGKLMVIVNLVVVLVSGGLCVGFVDVDVFGFLIFGILGVLGVKLM